MPRQSKISLVDILKIWPSFPFRITVVALTISIALFGSRNDTKVDKILFMKGLKKEESSVIFVFGEDKIALGTCQVSCVFKFFL